MKSLKLKLFLLALGCLFAVSCANKTLIRDSEYDPVYQALGQQNANDALLNFPEKERGGFITTFEKAWIKFWTDQEKFTPEDIQVVQNLSDQIEKRKFVSISHEASVFLIGESEDGYIPSEHEIISLHLFLTMLYLDSGNRDSAHVELKRAVEYLANNPEGKETTFDDPAMRLWLSSLWQAIGDDDHATVDLRKAMELSGDKFITRAIEDHNRKVTLVLTGVGPKPNWSNSGLSMAFEYTLEPNNKNDGILCSTRNWYEWHQNRNTKIRDSLIKSHYMASSLGHKTSRLSTKTTGLAVTGLIYTTAAIVLAGGAYAAIQLGDVSNADKIFGVGLLAATWIASKAESFHDSVNRSVEKSKINEAESLKIYRMIRFLPSYIEYIDENLAKNMSAPHIGYRKTLGAGNNQVEFIWNPE